MGMNFSRPFGTWRIRALLPTLKRWAIVIRSLQDGTPEVYPNWMQPSTGNTNAPLVSPQRGYKPVQQPGNPCLKQNQQWNQDDANCRKEKYAGSPGIKDQACFNRDAASETDPEWRRHLHGLLPSSA